MVCSFSQRPQEHQVKPAAVDIRAVGSEAIDHGQRDARKDKHVRKAVIFNGIEHFTFAAFAQIDTIFLAERFAVSFRNHFAGSLAFGYFDLGITPVGVAHNHRINDLLFSQLFWPVGAGIGNGVNEAVDVITKDVVLGVRVARSLQAFRVRSST